jgi:hypothetical protein
MISGSTPVANLRETRRLAVFLLLMLSAGCNNLGEFRTEKEEIFTGPIIGSQAGDEQSSFIRSGFTSYTKLELTFDPNKAESAPGTITARDEKGDIEGFDNTPLKPIKPLLYDPLIEYTFPGGGRIRNYIFGAHVQNQPRGALVFISLMEDGEIEARVVAPAVTASDGKTVEKFDGAPLGELFGVFRLKKASR